MVPHKLYHLILPSNSRHMLYSQTASIPTHIQRIQILLPSSTLSPHHNLSALQRWDPNIVPAPTRKLHGAKLDQVNKQIQLYNTQRQPVSIDFRDICDMIRMVKWNI